MPSLRKRVSSYFRQLSFHNEPRDKKHNINENSFITKYLQGQISLRDGPTIVYGKAPTDLPNFELDRYETGAETIVGCYSGPKGGLTTVRRVEKHLSVLDADIDYIDTSEQLEDPPPPVLKKSPVKREGAVDNTTMIIRVAGQEYCVTNRTKKRRSKSHSLGSIADFDIEIEKTKIDKGFYCHNEQNNQTKDAPNICSDNNIAVGAGGGDGVPLTPQSSTPQQHQPQKNKTSLRKRVMTKTAQNYNLSKSKSEGNPFQHKNRGKLIKVDRATSTAAEAKENTHCTDLPTIDDENLPQNWSRKSEFFYAISDSLYDRNQVTQTRNGNPVADCFGIIVRGDSAILAVADGVNWGEKASIAAKSAIHGSLHYLNKTIFNDSKPFEELTIKSDETSLENSMNNLIANSSDVFICLLRAFNCAHDLILENQGMLTTLTVAVVLPLKNGDGENFVCCSCNVGDTLAYVYSLKYGLRELTKGSHDVNCNRDMRDALGALGPVDGINPDLGNLTLSITKLKRGDIVMVASDGLTDNFDPSVCRFTVNSNEIRRDSGRKGSTTSSGSAKSGKVPVKPPRKVNAVQMGSVLQNLPTSSGDHSKLVQNTSKGDGELDALKSQFMKENAIEKKPHVIETKTSSLRRQTNQNKINQTITAVYKSQRSKTSLDMRSNSARSGQQTTAKLIVRNEDGIPYVCPFQRYELQLLLIEDILKNGISGKEVPITTAKKLCENLVSFAFSITSAKRRSLEDQDLYFDLRNGLLVEVSQQEKKIRRRQGLEKVQKLPGKLDHVTVVAWNVGNFECNI